MNSVIGSTFLMLFCIMVTSFVTADEIYYIEVSCEYQRPCSTEPRLTTTVCVFQNVENDEILNVNENSRYDMLELEIEIRRAIHEGDPMSHSL